MRTLKSRILIKIKGKKATALDFDKISFRDNFLTVSLKGETEVFYHAADIEECFIAILPGPARGSITYHQLA